MMWRKEREREWLTLFGILGFMMELILDLVDDFGHGECLLVDRRLYWEKLDC